jgi:VPDSG-CTERM motif
MNKLKYIAAVLIGIAGLALQQAKADTVASISLGAPNSAIAGYPSPYANASITLAPDGFSATVIFTSAQNATNTYLMGDGGSAALNVNGSFSLSLLSAVNIYPGFTPGTPVSGGAGTEDGFGNFTLTVNMGQGWPDSASTISFTVTNESGTAWTGITTGGNNTMLTANNKGFIAAAHIFVGGNPPDANAQALATGYAGNGNANTSVPDGGTTVMLLGMGLGMLGVVRRYLTS